MPDFPIIDSHIHIFDPRAIAYSWIKRLPPALQRAHSVADFRAALGAITVERVAVIEFLSDQSLAEAQYGEHLATSDPLVGAIVAHAPVERGAAVEADLDALAALPHVRSIRRILDGQYDNVLEPDFVAGVRALGRRGLPFELGVSHYGLIFAIELVRRCPETQFVLDHLATPAIRYGLWEPWASQIVELARLPNVAAKISGVLAGVDAKTWRPDQVTPYLKHAIEAFGFDRVMFGSDWPMLTLTATYAQWVEVVEAAIEGASHFERRKLYRETAARFYGLPPSPPAGGGRAAG